MRRPSSRSLTLWLVGALALGACSGANSPNGPNDPELPDAAFSRGAALEHAPDAPPLLTDRASFVAVQGEGDIFEMYYDNPRTPEPDEGDWFLRIEIPTDAQFVDATGNPHADGDSVAIVVEIIDPAQYLVHVEPHGSQFPGDPAILTFSLRYADYSGRNPNELLVWYQASTGQPWTAQPTTVDARGQQIFAELAHFSNYAIAW